VNRIPTVLLLALLLGYATIFVRPPTGGFRLRAEFDPFGARPRLVEQLIVAKKFKEALPLAEELRRSFPNEPQIASWLGVVQHELNNAQAEANAWEDYQRLSPAPVLACPNLPEAYRRLGDAQRAVASYERCRSLDPENPDRISDLADAYSAFGRSSETIELYREAAALDPYNPMLAEKVSALIGKQP
jgi:tetratricopeptide (TPR) repeat protein